MSSEKRQRLSREISKSYLLMVVTFLIMAVIILLFSWKYIRDHSKKDVSLVRDFMMAEFMEDENNNLKEMFDDVVKEFPAIPGVEYRVSKGEEVYETGPVASIRGSERGRISHDSTYSYYYYRDTIPTYGGEEIEVMIVKNMRDEKAYLYNQLIVVGVFMPLLILLVYLIYRRFYNKIIPQLKEIEGITDSINMDSLNVKLLRGGYYEEFENILISYERMLERLEDQRRSHISFVHNASHELKTPIFVIKGYSDILKRLGGSQDEVSREAVEVIGKEVRSMQSLTEKLLFLAKGADIDRRSERVEAGELIEESIKELRYIYREQEIEYSGGGEATTDRELLKIMLKNIIENACKYGEGRRIRVESCEVPGGIRIDVRDRGIGMKQAEVDEIFTEFYRGDKSRNREIEGHGLGMSIVGSIQRMLGAEIVIESEPGRGTMVRIWLRDNQEQEK